MVISKAKKVRYSTPRKVNLGFLMKEILHMPQVLNMWVGCWFSKSVSNKGARFTGWGVCVRTGYRIVHVLTS